MTAFSTSDWILSVILLTAILGAAFWLIVISRKHEAQHRVRAELWHRNYFLGGGGLVRALMARWSSQPKLTDRSSPPSE